MDPNELYRISLEIRKILKNDAFKTAVSMLRQDYANRFFSSDQFDKVGREAAYMKNAALDDLLVAFETILAANASFEGGQEEQE